MRLPFLLLISLATSALAAPLLGTKGSVAEGGLCRAYGCALRERAVTFPETMGLISHAYTLRGGTLVVGRTHDMAIISASLTIPAAAWNTPLVQDFTRTFAGVAVEPSVVRACVKRALGGASPAGTPLISGRVQGRAFDVFCSPENGGKVTLSVEDLTFEPR